MKPASRLQTTLREAVVVEGVGLHSGAPVRVCLRAADEGHGLRFVRVDLDSRPEVAATLGNVADTTLATTLADGRARVATVEHLVAALVALGVDNVSAEVEGPELPVLDGSSLPWLHALAQAGVREQAQAVRVCRVLRRVEVSTGDRRASLVPADAPELAATIHFDHPRIGAQALALRLDAESFRRELAWARTFGFLREAELLRARGLARGASLENAVVYTPEGGIANPEGLRAPDEAVRHKVLDMVGDLGLLGARFHGRMEALRPGHGITLTLLRALLADPAAYALES